MIVVQVENGILRSKFLEASRLSAFAKATADKSATLSPRFGRGGEGRERGRFMESLHSFLRMHRDHEPGRAQRRAGVSPAQRARQRERFRSVGVADGGRRDACPTLRFMERRDGVCAAPWAHVSERAKRRAVFQPASAAKPTEGLAFSF